MNSRRPGAMDSLDLLRRATPPAEISDIPVQGRAELRSIFSSALTETAELRDSLATRVPAEVLVVGELKSRYSVVGVLQNAGFRVVEATECIGALKCLLDETPQVVIVSEKKSLPDEIKLLRAMRCATTVPIIVVGSGGFRSADESLLCRADAYLPKSSDKEALIAFLHALLTRN